MIKHLQFICFNYKKILQEKYNCKNKHVNGFHFWKYENEILANRRARLEHMNEEYFESNVIKE